ncbi:unnamed protein product [Strongylus vulgaris]|uniref:Uncharacterized protein n=1 Tax=Strongylus vulgaris TaxID=40348 RepID=A0A3P7KML5_STRVU|nr:unnamed protein product [Strongylus vulgaris]
MDNVYSSTQKESLFTTRLPSGEEQRSTARVFHEEAAPPPKIKATQESPLRIRTIETATAAEIEQIRVLKRGEELREVMEQHRQEVDPQSRKRKLRKMKKSKKLSKKSKSSDVDSAEVSSKGKSSEEYRKPEVTTPQTVSTNTTISSQGILEFSERGNSFLNFLEEKIHI